jgi:hypothetical protein
MQICSPTGKEEALTNIYSAVSLFLITLLIILYNYI